MGNIFPMNPTNWNFLVGIKRYVQLKIQISRYGILALKNGNFAHDLGFRRNHFCWIRDVKLLLGFKIRNFLNQYVSVAKENAFWQFQSISIDQKMVFFKRSQNLMKLVLLESYRQYEARKYFLGIFRVRMWPQ